MPASPRSTDNFRRRALPACSLWFRGGGGIVESTPALTTKQIDADLVHDKTRDALPSVLSVIVGDAFDAFVN